MYHRYKEVTKEAVNVVELITAILNDKKICILDLVDENGQYKEEIRSTYREASQAGKLYCPECEGELELCAGAIIPPYFRHRSIESCPITQELKTKAGKRRYVAKKKLYHFAVAQGASEIVVEEGKSIWPYNPVRIWRNGEQMAFVYLDGKSRNYSELKQAQAFYEANGVKPVWFLNKKHQSKTKNLTSDEAESSQINKGIIYYLDLEEEALDLRKCYTNAYGENKYYTETFLMSQLEMNECGDFTQLFITHYEEVAKAAKCKLDKVLRVPIEDGVDEIYFKFTYVFMYSLMEIWILPPFMGIIQGIDMQQEANRHRVQYLEMQNHYFEQLGEEDRDVEVARILSIINKRINVWEWLSEIK